MNKGKLILKLAYLVGYLLFAGFSAYFTASSLSLNLLNGTNLWLVFALVLVVAILAGWCLSKAIEELSKRVGASKVTFFLSLIGFIIFWTFSFVTNVHYFFVEKHGYSILSKELASSKNYIQENTSRSNKNIDEQKDRAKLEISALIQSNIDNFDKELRNTMDGHLGFGEACVSILKSSENMLRRDSKTYNDKNEYRIFDDEKDKGDIGITQRSRFDYLQEKYDGLTSKQLNKKLAVIDNYYERKKDQNTELLDILEPINDLEENHLPQVLKDGSVDAYYKYYDQQDGRVISKMPEGYTKSNVVKEGDEIKEFKVYPSNRMFDTVSVWGDITSGRLAGMSMLQWIIIALIFDIVSFILFTLFIKQS